MAVTNKLTEENGLTLFERWLATAGLYRRQAFSKTQAHQIAAILWHNYETEFGFDNYCPTCASRSHFKSAIQVRIPQLIAAGRVVMVGGYGGTDASYLADHVGPALQGLLFKCTRDASHEMMFFIWHEVLGDPERLVLMKIGQHPSSFDLMTPELERLGKLLNADDRRELRSAELAASSGQHVAAFAYLRRVFERRVELAHAAAQQDPLWDESNYQANVHRMDERIQALRDHLPPFLVQHRSAYGVLSRGIHELSEEECSTGYTALHEGIHLILEQEIERQARAEREKRLGSAIANLGQQFSKA